MPVHIKGRGPRQNRRLVSWPRWVQVLRGDRDRHAAARAEARAHADLRPGERLLAVAWAAGGDLLAATDWALYHPTGQAWARLGWEQVDRVDWDEGRQVLILTGLTPAVPRRTVLHLAKAWDLPAVAAERVSWAKLFDQRISLNGAAGARMVARRIPGEAHVTWLVILDHGLDPGNPGIRDELESALTDLQAVTGIEDAAGPSPGLPGLRRIAAVGAIERWGAPLDVKGAGTEHRVLPEACAATSGRAASSRGPLATATAVTRRHLPPE